MNNIINHCFPVRALAMVALTAMLQACGGGASTETNPVTSNNSNTSVSGYVGPSAQSQDIAEFQINLWTPLHSQNACVGCHIEGGQSPQFVRADDINLAYAAANALIDRDNPANSRLVTKVGGGHNCWLPNDAACATAMTSFIENWVSASSGGGRQIQLVAPVPRAPGATKTFPDNYALTTFQSTVWQLVTGAGNCNACHADTAPNPQSPFFASDDVAEAYAAAKSKINLNDPALSRLVLRLRDEFHNCWTASCANDAAAMEAQIVALANSITVNQVQAPVVFSDAMTIQDGVPAAGGNRYEDDVIALYEFRTGSGNTVLDLSTNTPNLPPLNLTISGDVDWVGGYGIQINDGKAQGSTTNSKKLHDLIKATGQYSIEAWVVPANVVQEGPARIISYSAGTTARNFTLGQTQYNYDFLQRSSTTDGNGEPALSTADADEDLQASLQHVVVTYDPVNGRRIYVNGAFTDDLDPVPTGNLNDWDDSFAFVLGNEVSNDRQWQGIIRLVAIHNRALTLEQIQQNFAAGVGAKFYLLFGIGGIGGVPAGSYIMFEVEQFDSYSYLFNKPTFINLDPAVVPGNILIEGLRIGINSKEAPVGQAYANLSVTVGAGSYDPATGQQLSPLGTVIGLENGTDVPSPDEFYLTFETLGVASNPPPAPVVLPVQTLPAPGEASDIGLRTFDEINATLAAVTGVDPALVQAEFLGMRRALPSIESIESFLSAHQMSIAQLTIAYCDALVEDTSLRTAFFKGVPADPAFAFTSPVYTAFNMGAGDSVEKNQIVNALFNKTVRISTGSAMTNAPVLPDVKAELIGPAGTNANNLFDRLAGSCASAADPACQQDRTRAILKAMCASTLGSAIMLVQ